MPVVSFCRKPGEKFHPNCSYDTEAPFYESALKCIEDLENVSQFIDAIKFENPFYCKYKII